MTNEQHALLITSAISQSVTAIVALLTTGLTLFFGGKAAAKVAGGWSRAVKISEFRQKWIEELRADISLFVGAAHRWIRLYEDYNDLPGLDPAARIAFEQERVRPVQNEAIVILYRIRMRINPLEGSPTKAEDDEFLSALQSLLNPGKIDPRSPEASWMSLADAAVERARRILKREWEETKHPNGKT